MSTISERSPIYSSVTKNQIDNLCALTSQAHVEGNIDELKTSPVRRTFCLIVLIDLAICFILYVVHLKSNGKDLKEQLSKEVTQYEFNNSLFDVTVLAVCRFAYLEGVYGCMKSIMPWYIAISTFITSVCVIVKICMIKNEIFGYILIVTSFIICWTETLFLIYRVLPKEKAAKAVQEYHRYMISQYGSTDQTLSSDILTTNDYTSRKNSISDDEEYFSPRQTRPGSPSQLINKEVSTNIKLLKEKASRICVKSDWKYLCGNAVEGFITYKETPQYTGRIYKIECFLNIAPEVIFKDMVYNVDKTPLWNPQVRSVKRIELYGENADIIHNVSTEAMKGYISPRDFVLLRVWGVSSDQYFIYTTSHTHIHCPPLPNVVRGEYGIGIILFEKSMAEPNLSKCIWIMNYDIKGNIFRSIVDKAMPKILLAIAHHLKEHCATLNTCS